MFVFWPKCQANVCILAEAQGKCRRNDLKFEARIEMIAFCHEIGFKRFKCYIEAIKWRRVNG